MAFAGIGTDIGVYFPVGGHRRASESGYASFTVGTLIQELEVEEKRGRLVMKLIVSNAGEAPYTVEHPDGQEVEFIVLNKKGEALYRWSDGVAFTQAAMTSAIAPHDKAVYRVTIERSDYKKIRETAVLVTAFLKDTPYTLSAAVPESPAESRGSAVHGAIRVGSGHGWPHW